MSAIDQLRAAARRVLDGDESRQAANQLETVVLNHFFADDRFEDLLYALSLYSPGAGTPYLEANELRDAVTLAMAKLLPSGH